jgi:hypothetical protein
MQCELCQHEAVTACEVCGTGFCADHISPFCFRCATAIKAARQDRGSSSTAIVSGDREPRFSGKGYLQEDVPARPTVHVEDAGPPACYRCGGLARRLCQNCHNLFCPEHAGGSELCDHCARSSRLGLLVVGGMLLLLGVLLLVIWLMGGS